MLALHTVAWVLLVFALLLEPLALELRSYTSLGPAWADIFWVTSLEAQFLFETFVAYFAALAQVTAPQNRYFAVAKITRNDEYV